MKELNNNQLELISGGGDGTNALSGAALIGGAMAFAGEAGIAGTAVAAVGVAGAGAVLVVAAGAVIVGISLYNLFNQ